MERKLATVLFADLVGSTELVSDQDPEITRRSVTAFFDAVAGCIETHGGTVEKFAGDAVMAAFGIPQAHEDDAERAVRAALGIIQNVHELGVEARVGIEAGEVVVDEADSTFATGPAVNVAARLQQAAGPGEILIGDAAHRLTEGRVEAEDVGPLELRGFRRPLAAYRAVAAVDGRPQSASVSAPFVGREPELELLENTLARTIRDRRPHVFTIYGEPGVGKSRLLREFLAGVEGTTILAGRALPYGEGVTYCPRAEALLAEHDIAESVRAKLLEKTEGNPLFVEETVRMLLEEGAAGGDRIPDTVQALIGARIDRLPAGEKIILQRGSVIGRTFWGGAIDYLSSEYDADELEDMLDDLLLRDFVTREERSTISGESAYRFKHVMIRQVAYGGLSKSSRAEYHTRFAEWLHEKADKELVEIRAYHLDQACTLYAELDGRPPQELAQTAARALQTAGKRALARESNLSARKLLLRALELEPTLERRYLAARAAWQLGDLPVLRHEMAAVVEEAAASGARDLEPRARTAPPPVAAALGRP